MNFNVDPKDMTPQQRIMSKHMAAALVELSETLDNHGVEFCLVYTDPTGYEPPVRALRLMTPLEDAGAKALLTDVLKGM